MDHEEYLNTQNQIGIIAGIVTDMPLRDFIEMAEHADAIGPFIDPTLWIQASEDLGTILDLARSLRNFQSLIHAKIALGKLQKKVPTETS